MDILIRPFEMNDALKLDVLFSELGYPAEPAIIEKRLENIISHKDYFALVIEHHQQIIGFCGMCKMMFFERDGYYMRILAFVIDSHYRNLSLGRQLLTKAEEIATAENCVAITLNSGNREERNIAHQFYISNGYYVKSSGFVKEL